jgi:ATP-dependent protease ClpP protease subunit
MRLYRTNFASFMACALTAATFVAGAANAKPEARRWYTMSAKGAVGEIHILDAIFPGLVSAQSFQRDLKALGDVTALEIHINSPGGDVFEGNTIHNMIKAHKAATKTVIIDGLAASIASIIAMAGDTIVMPKNSMMMIHDPNMVAWGRPEDLTKAAGTLSKVRDTLIATYADRTGLDAAEVASLMADETWFTAQEAVDKGFADETAAEVKMAAAWVADLTNFKKAPPAFVAALAAPGAAPKPEPGSPSGEHETKESTMNKQALLALAAALGLAISGDVDKVIEQLVTDKADMTAAIAALVKLKPAASALPTTEQLNTAVATALAAERTRVTDIRGVATQLKLDKVPTLNAKVDEIIASGISVNDARIKLVDLRAVHEESVGPIVAFSGNAATFDNPEFRQDAIATAFAHRAQPNLVKMTDQAKPFAAMSMLEIAQDCAFRSQGKRVAIGDRENLVILALHSSSDFPYILGNVLNKILLPAYMAATPTYRAVGGQKNFNDFRAHTFMRLGDFPDLLKVDESGEVKFGTISEGKETVTMYAYGRRMGLSRQMLINDDLSAFTDMAAMAGTRVSNFENAAFYTALTSNSSTGPTMNDGNKLFDSSNHGNYTSSGTAVNVILELGKMRAKMRKQTGLDGVKLNLSPKYLLVGPDNETVAEQVTTQTTAQQSSNVNKIGPSLTLAVDANIANYGWYLFADPMVAPAMIWGSLVGQTGPRVMTKEGWSVEGVEFKVMRDFGTGAIDYRPITFNAGTAPS